MGTTNFRTTAQGATAQAAYNNAVQAAENEYGHQQGYSGQINSSRGYGFRLITGAHTRAEVDVIEQAHIDKGGDDCIAVRLAETVKVSEKVLTVKVQARDAYTAQRVAETQARVKVKAGAGQTVTADAQGRGSKVKDGKAPKLQIAKAGKSQPKLRVTNKEGRVVGEYATQAEMIADLKARLADNPRETGDQYTVEKVQPAMTLTVENLAGSMPTFEVQVKVTVTKAGKATDNYVFIGWARE